MEPQPTPPQDTAPATTPQPVTQPEAPKDASQNMGAPAAETKMKNLPKWLKVVLAAVAAFVIFFVVVFFIVGAATKDAVKVSDRLVADIQSKNSSDAYSLVSQAFKDTSSEEDLATTIDDVSPVLQGKAKATEKKVGKNTGSKEQAIIIYTIDTSDGKKYIRVVLQKDSTWQVVNFRSSDTPLDTSAAN